MNPHRSSPLARGLPAHRHRRIGLAGIIPARAGFTRRTAPRGGNPQDHPRSRGVYAMPDGSSVVDEGLSPLARGLHNVKTIFCVDFWIIPARAGVTLTEIGELKARKDHPR